MTADGVKEILDLYVKEQRPIMIKYNGGSQPGTKRWVLPLMLTDTHLRARDVATDIAKMFSLKKIEIVSEHNPVANYVEEPKQKRTLTGAIRDHVPELESLGWRVVVTDESVELFEPGSEKPIAGIRPNYNTVLAIDLDEGASVAKERSEWPWRVFGPGFAAQIFNPDPDDDLAFPYKRLGSAVDAFLKQARQYASKPR